MSTNWHPSWWTDGHASAWDRIKEAMRRDWEQTKHDLHLRGGHELNQDVNDTVKQAAGTETIPSNDRPNPPRVIGSWDDVELPLGYGYAARQKYGAQHPRWNDHLDRTLRSEWDQGKDSTQRAWNDVKDWVRRGYEYDGTKH
jgi:hypothetical protein